MTKSKLGTDSITGEELQVLQRKEEPIQIPIRFWCVARHDYKTFSEHYVKYMKMDPQKKELVRTLTHPKDELIKLDEATKGAKQLTDDHVKAVKEHQKASIQTELEDIRIQRLFTPKQQPAGLSPIVLAKLEEMRKETEAIMNENRIKREQARSIFGGIKRAKDDFFGAIAQAFTCCI